MRISGWSSDVCSSDLSDTVRNHELGIKGRVGRMSYNADVLYVDWKDPQVNSSTTWWGFFAVQNAQKASTRGVELELAGGIGEGFSYNLGYTYTKAQDRTRGV